MHSDTNLKQNYISNHPTSALMNTKNDCFLRALLRQPVERTPVWIMRQAGRYLPEYRKIRQQAGNFLNLCTNPDLACEVTLQPLNRFRLDAAILFSDILTIPDAMGLGLSINEGEGPRFERPIRLDADIRKLPIPDPEIELSYVMDTIRLIQKSLHGRVPLIGFSGSPWTLATYMVEGQGGTNFRRVKTLMYEQPTSMHTLLEKLADSVIDYLNAQIAAGVQAVMIFDTWGGILATDNYREFSLQYCAKIIESLNKDANAIVIPSILFTKGGGQWLEDMSSIGCSALGIDWTTDLGVARKRVGHRVALQGNLDPISLYASTDTIRRKIERLLESYGTGSGHIFNLGHGILPDINPDHVEVMIETIHQLSPNYH